MSWRRARRHDRSDGAGDRPGARRVHRQGRLRDCRPGCRVRVLSRARPAVQVVGSEGRRRTVSRRRDDRRSRRIGSHAARRRANRAQFSSAAVGHCHAGRPVRPGGGRPHHGARHAKDNADAADAREIRRPGGWRHESSLRPLRRHPDQGQPHRAGRRRRCRCCESAGAQPDLTIEVEADTLAQVDEALAAGAETILVDNMSTPDICDAVRRSRRSREDRDLGRSDARSHSGAGSHRRRLCLRGRADALRARRRHQL